MRHADAPGGAGDPPGFRLEDCSTQRNLSEQGRVQARAVGVRLKAERIAIAKLLSSPWCRCLETARLMNLGAAEIAPAFSNSFVLREQRVSLADAARLIIMGWKGPETLLVVTHGANIAALTNTNPAEAEIVVVRARSDETLREIGRIPPPKH
jgi:phosphohistidine phosphatase SixA